MDLGVRATWEAEASVWVAESNGVAGLITERTMWKPLMSKFQVMIPELLKANGALPPGIGEFPFSVIGQDRTDCHAA